MSTDSLELAAGATHAPMVACDDFDGGLRQFDDRRARTAEERQTILLPSSAQPKAPVLELKAIHVWISGRQVLQDISFRVGPGDLMGLIGANGAGKTTILRVILGLQATSGGSVVINGKQPSRRNRPIGYVPQKVMLDPDIPLRARDLVDLGLDGHRAGFALPTAARRRRVDEVLDAVGANAFGDVRIGELSGGQQQRVLIAHALIHRPKLLLLDEPLANLDLGSQHEIVTLLARLSVEHGVAVILSTHDINPLIRVMNGVIYVASGRAVCGTPDDVVQSDVLTGLYGHPVTVLRVQDRVIVVTGEDAAGPVGGMGSGV